MKYLLGIVALLALSATIYFAHDRLRADAPALASTKREKWIEATDTAFELAPGAGRQFFAPMEGTIRVTVTASEPVSFGISDVEMTPATFTGNPALLHCFASAMLRAETTCDLPAGNWFVAVVDMRENTAVSAGIGILTRSPAITTAAIQPARVTLRIARLTR